MNKYKLLNALLLPSEAQMQQPVLRWKGVTLPFCNNTPSANVLLPRKIRFTSYIK